MERKITILFVLFFLLMPLHKIIAHGSQDLDINNINAQLDYELVYLDQDTCQTILRLKCLLPDYEWSKRFRNLHFDIEDEGNIALYEQVDSVINESLVACRKLSDDLLHTMSASLEAYQALLHAGKVHITYGGSDVSEQALTRACCSSSGVKKICKLSVNCLSVTGRFFVNGVDFTTLTAIAGAVGATGPQGIQGIAGVLGAIGATGATGAQGIAGVLGAVGAAGPAGAQGIAGVIGAIGAAGAAGAAGAPGIPGAPGAQGIPGIPGVGGILGYGYIYNLTAETVAVEAPIVFDSNGLLAGVTHATPSPSIIITNAGTYYISFSASGTEPNQFAIFVNGIAIPQTVYGSGAGTQQNNGYAILALGAGDTITIVNHSSAAAVGLASVVGGTQANVNASVIILRVT